MALAVKCQEQALRFWTPETDPLWYAGTQANLGLAYAALPTGDQAENLGRAIECFQQALLFYTPEADPLGYALIQSNLGDVYRITPIGNRAENLKRAIQCFQQALRFRTPATAPLAYAATQNNLGLAYAELPIGDQAGNLAQAIECFQLALLFYTPEAEPFAYRMTTCNQADLYFEQGIWDAAFRTYRMAINIGEQLYRVGLSTESKATEVIENATLYPQAAFAAVRCGEIAEALLVLERGKTRFLAEALRLHMRRPPHVPDEIWNMFEQTGATLYAQQVEKTLMDAEMRDPVQAYEAHTQAAEAANTAFDTAIKQIQTYAPHFLAPIDLSTIESQVSDKQTALLAFCITEQGSIGFVVSKQDQETVRVVEVPGFTQTDLSRLFAEWDEDGQPTGGWLGAYDRDPTDETSTAFQIWQDTITQVLAEVGEHLLTPLVSALSPDIKRLILLPAAELFLFPLHAVPLSGNASRSLCDCYQVSYAPSIEVLAGTRVKFKQEVKPELYAVIDPENNLQFAPFEGDAIARLFAQSTVDTGQAGTKERVFTGMRKRTYLHFSCHGGYDWSDPPASGLRLADEQLTLADLQRGGVDLSAARLVTLSACETGITDISRGSAAEYVGIPAGFLLAGVPCVISSLWAVRDFSTALVMERFYHNHLVERMDVVAALQKAQVWLRDLRVGDVAVRTDQWYRQSLQKGKGKEELLKQMRHYQSLAKQNPALRPFAHPYYWAAFTVNGG